MSQPIFYDPERRRWRVLRRLLDVLAVTVSVLLVFFIVSIIRDAQLPALSYTDVRRPLKPVPAKHRRPVPRRKVHRDNSKLAPLSTEEGVRAAFYVAWDAASFSSLKEYAPQIDFLFAEWLHITGPEATVRALGPDNTLFDVFAKGKAQPVDEKVMSFLRSENAETEVIPLVNNFDPVSNQWQTSIGQVLMDEAQRARLRRDLMAFVTSDKYAGLSLDLEEVPLAAQPGFNAFIAELAHDLHSRGLRMYVNLPTHNPDYDYAFIAAHADWIILMNYDQHVPVTAAGPVAAQDWYVNNLREVLRLVPVNKLICGVGNYGYDWAAPPRGKKVSASVRTVSAQEAWLTADESSADIELDSDSLNPHFAYEDETGVRHDVWFLDAVTALNQMRAASRLGVKTFALWRLGSEDRSLWNIWDVPGDPAAPDKLRTVPPGQEVDLEGRGEILRIEQTPHDGSRTMTVDQTSGLITDQSYNELPSPYQIAQYGASPNQVALTFDDGPDPKYTPLVLDVLRREQVPATFFLIGSQAEKFPGVTRRIVREGHEIGNHTWSHPDISNVSSGYMRLELNLTERYFAGELSLKPLFFRPPYSIDEEPDTADQVRPLESVQNLGYITVGSKIDPNDWRANPRNSAEQLRDNVVAQLELKRGNVILLHDGGGNRDETVRALPLIIGALRGRGYTFVPVSALLGKGQADVMPPVTANEYWSARIDKITFTLYGWLENGIVVVFFLGNILMTARLLLVGCFAVWDRFFRSPLPPMPEGEPLPPVAILVPAYNEEKVIVRTVRAALAVDYPPEKLRVIVIDDGSTDRTLEVARQEFAAECAAGRVLVLGQANAGKAAALNLGLEHLTETIFLGIDADTVIAPQAVARLVPHFRDPEVAAVAGNARVGNRVNLWTRWQALEYITSQNFERRALNAMGAVSVVPGAIGAWRTAAVRAAGGYQVNTVAEDADLTMSLLERGLRVQYEDRAFAYTEAPISAGGLMRQRFRWSFGILQAVWKHRAAFYRPTKPVPGLFQPGLRRRRLKLGWIALPNIAVFQILLPLVSPAIDLMFLSGVAFYFTDKHFHPDTANPASLEKLLVFFAIFLLVDLATSVLAFALERRERGSERDVFLLGHVWLQRFAYRQLFSVVLFRTLKRALDGRPFAWDKLERTAVVSPASMSPVLK